MFLISDDSWEIKETKEKGLGVFAKKKLTAGTIIGDYLGKVIKTIDYDIEKEKERHLYLMYLSDEKSIFPNLKKPGVHFLNHSCLPNCWIYTYKSHTLFFALKDIKPGEEITISYLLSPKDDCKPCRHDCKCQNKVCTGTMHMSQNKYDKWQNFQNNQKTKGERLKATVGRNLPMLSSYPKIISRDPIYKVIKSIFSLT